MIVERAGFDFVYVGGYDVSLTLLGLPDVGLITETEMLGNARNIARAVMGYRIMHVSLAGMRTTMQAMWDYAQDLKARGAQAEIDFQKRLAAHPMGAFHRFAGFPEMKALEEKFLPAEEVKKKYDGAVGL